MQLSTLRVFWVLLPICLIGYCGVGVAYVSVVCNGNTRWLFGLVLLLFLASQKQLMRSWNVYTTLTLSLYVAWCILTSFWSDIFILSFVKSTLYLLTVITMLSAGIAWVLFFSWENALSYVKWFAYLILPLLCFGKWIEHDIGFHRGIVLYSGPFISGGPNMLGFFMAAIAPYFLWVIYDRKKNKRFYLFSLSLLLICVYFLLIAMSRSAIAMTLIVLAGYFFELHVNRKIMYTFLIIVIGMIAMFFYSDTITHVATQYIYKSEDRQALFHYERQMQFQKTYQAAMAGGWVGIGYGVTYGDSSFHLQHLSAAQYGREKGNSQLAVIEETGWIGLVFYVLLLTTILFQLFRMHVHVSNGKQKQLINILFGLFIGMILQSTVEAWWSSPGAPETVYFWLLIGVIRGVELSIKRSKAFGPVVNESTDRIH